MRKTLWLVNPAAGNGRGAEVWEKLRALDSNLRTAAVIRAEEPAEAAQAIDHQLVEGASDAAPSRFDRLVVVGGDGTVHLAVNRLLQLGLGSRVALGLVPAGTGSDLARSLDLPQHPRKALEVLRNAKPRSLDLLEVISQEGHSRYSVNITSAGLSGLVSEAVNALPRKNSRSYLTATISALFRYEPVPCRVKVDGSAWHEGPTLLLAVANGRYFGKGMKVAPHANPRDGILEVIHISGMPRWRLLFQLPRIYLGTHLKSPLVRTARGQEVELEPLSELPPFELDGETLKTDSVRIRILPAALQTLLPAT